MILSSLPKFGYIIVVTWILVASGVTVGDDLIVDGIKFTGGRPLDQIKKLQRHDSEIYRTYSYIRCLHSQIGRHFGDEADNERQKIFPLDLSVLSNRVERQRADIERRAESLKFQNRITDGAKISLTEQIAINRFESELKDFRATILAEALADIPRDLLLIENIAACDKILDR